MDAEDSVYSFVNTTQCEKLSEKLVGIIPKLSWALHFQDITPEAVCGFVLFILALLIFQYSDRPRV
jgi:hypothetical protein